MKGDLSAETITKLAIGLIGLAIALMIFSRAVNEMKPMLIGCNDLLTALANKLGATTC